MLPFFAFVSIVANLVSFANSHAALLDPPSRNFLAHQGNIENCPHCLQAGGPSQVFDRSDGIWPTMLDPESHGLCGDPVQGKPQPPNLASSTYMHPTPVQRSYHAGEIVEFRVGVNAHHKGHYEFRICDFPIDGTTLTSATEGQDCLNKWVLERAPLDPSCGIGVVDNPADCQPIDTKHKGRWYIPPQHSGGQGAGDQNEMGEVSWATEYHVMKYEIPRGLNCTRCTLQWYWSTGNTCLYDADYLGPDGYFQRNRMRFEELGWNPSDWCPFCTADWATCENSCCKTGGTFTEEFWNCADIAVIGNGSVNPPPEGTTTTVTPEVTTTTVTPEVTTATVTATTVSSPEITTTTVTPEVTTTTASDWSLCGHAQDCTHPWGLSTIFTTACLSHALGCNAMGLRCCRYCGFGVFAGIECSNNGAVTTETAAPKPLI